MGLNGDVSGHSVDVLDKVRSIVKHRAVVVCI